jgi:hypothetical protein
MIVAENAHAAHGAMMGPIWFDATTLTTETRAIVSRQLTDCGTCCAHIPVENFISTSISLLSNEISEDILRQIVLKTLVSRKQSYLLGNLWNRCHNGRVVTAEKQAKQDVKSDIDQSSP